MARDAAHDNMVRQIISEVVFSFAQVTCVKCNLHVQYAQHL